MKPIYPATDLLRCADLPMRPTVCLNMIVKNERSTIARCLNAALPFIDSWVIVDTGSTDGTQDQIQSIMKDKPGALFQRPWQDFGHNRSEAIALAEGRADFILLCDADMELQVRDTAWRPDPRHDGYYVRQYVADRFYSNVRLVNGRHSGEKRWCYRCTTHEFIDSRRSELNTDLQPTDAIAFLDHSDGGSKTDKFTRDAAMLTAELASLDDEARSFSEADRAPSARPGLTPHDLCEKLRRRVMFYLAQTRRDLEQHQNALELYQRRATLGGWDEEVWYAMYQAARMTELIGAPSDLVAARYLYAFNARPTRVEPLVALAAFHRRREEHALAYLYARHAIEVPEPKDLLFIERGDYRWRRYDELAVASFWQGKFRDSALICERLLATKELPQDQRDRIAENLTMARSKL